MKHHHLPLLIMSIVVLLMAGVIALMLFNPYSDPDSVVEIDSPAPTEEQLVEARLKASMQDDSEYIPTPEVAERLEASGQQTADEAEYVPPPDVSTRLEASQQQDTQ